MTAIDPAYAKQLRINPINGHTLTDDEYTAFLRLIAFDGEEIMTDTDGRVITHTNGQALFGKP